MDIKKIPEIINYKIYIKSNSSKNTSQAYLSDLEIFFIDMQSKYPKSKNMIYEIKPRDINLYLMGLENIKSSTRARKRASIIKFFKFLYENEYTKKNIIDMIASV